MGGVTVRRFVDWGNGHPFLISLTFSTIVMVGGIASLNHETAEREADLRRLSEERAAAIVVACELFASRVELTFHETYEYLRQRALENRGQVPGALEALDNIASDNLHPSFCRPPIKENP
jgi:hypothetical protein